ncbi:hypothetical protein HYT56_02430 [Candidatus Woesearchaeota archaeon]|nr:hypothetical protein [Candidatus Woesearchaeota archaeon]
MKHNFKITAILITLFFLTQIIGLAVVNSYITVEKIFKEEKIIQDGKEITIIVETEQEIVGELPYGIERPEMKEKTSYLQIIFAIVFATVLAMVLLKFQAMRLWKLWFFLSVFFTLLISFNAFVHQVIALMLALGFAAFKTFKNNVVIHNFSELFIYGGLAAIFVPVVNITAMIVILFLISIYDFIAVWKTKHMIRLAKFQAKIKLFAGLFIPYEKKVAILGGGDMGFPLLFSGVLFKTFGWNALIAVAMSTIALAFLLLISQRNKYYPAMPFLTVGCLIGFVIIKLI